jgi:hypothetical protein
MIASNHQEAEKRAAINLLVIFEWQELLPVAIQSQNQLHREIVSYLLSLPGKRKPAYTHAKATWNLDRHQFDRELSDALRSLRIHLKRFYGITSAADLGSV